MKKLLFFLNCFIVIGLANSQDPSLLKPNENKSIIEFKLQHKFFEYIKSNDFLILDYDYYLLEQNYTLKKIFSFIKERKESDFYLLTHFLYNNNNDSFLLQNDETIIKSLQFLIVKDVYIDELNKSDKVLWLKERIKKINESNEYLKLYKLLILNRLNYVS